MSKTYEIRTPDGKSIRIQGPDDATDDELVDFAREQTKGGKFANSPVQVDHTGTSGMKAPEADLRSTMMQGATLGYSDELSGIAGAATDALIAPFSSRVDFDPLASYKSWRDRERQRVETTRKENPWAAPILELGGGLLTGGTAARGALQGVGTSARDTIGGLFGTALSAAKPAAKAGAVAGFGYGEGMNNSIAGAGLGGALGGALGFALPIALRTVSRPIETALNYLRPQAGIGRSLVAKAMRDDAITPSQAGAALDAARSRGVPLALTDLGENLRGLTGAVSRAPGPSRRLVRRAVETRQAEQGERIRGAIQRDLGPIGDIDAMSEHLTQRANAAATPLYDEARAAPVISTPELESVLATPAGRQALAKAREIAANERRDPQALGFALDADGNVSLSPTLHIDDDGSIVREPARQRGYTLDTIDLVKRGLDALLEPNRNPITRRLDLAGNPLAQSTNSVRGQLLSEADRLNPAYARARAAFAEPARQRTALQQGERMVGATAEDVERATNGLLPAERSQYALGYRTKLAEDLERRVAGGNKVNALIGTPRKQRALGQLFGDEPGFDNFVGSLGDEAMANETYRSIMTGSSTANRLADDAAVSDQSLLDDLSGKALKGAANGGLAGAAAELLTAFRDRQKFGAGATGQRAREDAAALLTEIDPIALSQSLRQGLRQEATRRIASRAMRRRVRNTGMFAGRAVGGISAYGLRPVDD